MNQPKLRLICLLIFSIPAFVQAQVFDWGNQETGDEPTWTGYYVQDKHVVADKLGNVISATGWGGNNYYAVIELIKYSPQGVLVWKKIFRDWNYIWGLNVDDAGNIYFISSRYNYIDQFEPVPNNVTSQNCLTKLDTKGRIAWIKPIGEMVTLPWMNARGRNLLKKSSDNSFYFAATKRVKNFQFLGTTLTSFNNRDTAIAIVKFDTTGTVIWNSHITSVGDIQCVGIDINDNGRLVVAGTFYGGAQTMTGFLTDNDYTAMFYGTFDMETGHNIWLHKISGFMMYGSRVIDVVITKTNVIKTLITFSANSAGFMQFAGTKVPANQAGYYITTTSEDNKEVKLTPAFSEGYTGAYGMQKNNEDELFIAASSTSNAPAPTKVTLWKLDSSCSAIWKKTIDPVPNSGIFLQVFLRDKQLYLTGIINSTANISFGKSTITPYKNKVTFTAKLIDHNVLITGNVFADLNKNNVLDNNEPKLPYRTVKAESATFADYDVTDFSGRYTVYADTGLNKVELLTIPPYFTVSPTEYVENISAGTHVLNKNFALQPIGNVTELFVDVTLLTRARPGFVVQYMVTFANSGNNYVSNKVALKFDSSLQFLSTTGSVFSKTSDSIVFNFNLLKPFEIRSINVTFLLPPTVQVGSILSAYGHIFPKNDLIPENNVDSVSTLVTAAFDPNDKTVDRIHMRLDSVSKGTEFLEYLVRFQNTGTDTAYTVSISDTLSKLLDIESVRFLSSSHLTDIDINQDGILTFNFQNILLPDSNVNEKKSHGFVHFLVKPKKDVISIDTISNAVSIYFDYNAPVKTNTAKSYFPEIFGTVNTLYEACSGVATITVTNVGGGTAPYLFSSDGISFSNNPTLVVGAGVYSVTVKDNDGLISVIGMVEVFNPPVITQISTVNNGCFGGIHGQIGIAATANSGTITYALVDVTGTQKIFQAIDGATVTFTGLGAGTYTITATNGNGCSAISVNEITQPALITTNSNGTPDMLLTSVISPPTAAFGNTVTISYFIAAKNNSNISVQGVILRVTKPYSGYQLKLADSDLMNWAPYAESSRYVEFQLAKGIEIPCSGTRALTVAIIRNGYDSPSIGIPVSASIRLSGTEQDQTEYDNLRATQFRIE